MLTKQTRPAMKNRSAISGILSMRCPKCREGKMFLERTLYTTKFMKMNDRCSCCGLSFTPEPSYYFGAMFVSYALNTAYFVAVWVALLVIMDEIPLGLIIGLIIALVIGLLPITFRMSRVLWIYIFVRYKGEGSCANESVQQPR
ncbi:MAG: DUF983 domain-containing protein [Chryseosolibacter sp.]